MIAYRLHNLDIKKKAGKFLAFFAIFCFSLLFLSGQTFAQYTDTTATPINVDVESYSETVSSSIPKQHSPTKATLMSTVLPGLGQAYNKQYWKLPIIYTGAALVTYFAVDNYRGAQKFLKEYKYRINGDSVNFNPNYLNYSADNILNLYNAYQRNFELSLIIGGVIYLFNILDAYVFAHLFTFDLNEDISMQFTPIINSSLASSSYLSPELGFSLKFTFR